VHGVASGVEQGARTTAPALRGNGESSDEGDMTGCLADGGSQTKR
jgi:hypothetical protein